MGGGHEESIFGHRRGPSCRYIFSTLLPLTSLFDPRQDPAHNRDPSGCTAVAALITNDNKIYVVRSLSYPLIA